MEQKFTLKQLDAFLMNEVTIDQETREVIIEGFYVWLEKN